MTLATPFLLEHQDAFRASVSPLGFILSYHVDALCVLVAIATFSVRACVRARRLQGRQKG